jgi:hypothetical protein
LSKQEVTQEEFGEKEVTQAQKKVGSPENTAKLNKKQEAKISIKYSNAGDTAFKEGTLVIKLSDGLRMKTDTIKDTFRGETVQVDPSQYKSQAQKLEYGPGTKNQKSAQVKPGEQGTVTFEVEVVDKDAEMLAVKSYLQGKDGDIGKPGMVFLDRKLS